MVVRRFTQTLLLALCLTQASAQYKAPFLLVATAPATPYALVDTATYGASTSEIVLPVDFGTDGNRYAVVVINQLWSSVSAVSGGGQSGAEIVSRTTGGYCVHAYGITAPSSGVGSVTVTLAGSTDMRVTVYTFSGVHQTSPIDVSYASNGSDNTPTRTIDAIADNFVIDAVTWDSGPATATNGQTVKYSGTSPLPCATGIKVSSGYETETWNLTWGSYDWSMIALSVNPDGD